MRLTWSVVRSKWFPALVAVLGIVLVAQNFFLARTNRSLRAGILEAASDTVKTGDRLGQLRGSTLKGTQVGSALVGEKPSLVMSLSVRCGFCQKNVEAWRRLAGQAKALGAQVFWLSRDATSQLADFSWAPDGDVVIADPTHWTYEPLKLKLVPQSIVVDKDGRVTAARAGVIDEAAERDLAAALKQAVADLRH